MHTSSSTRRAASALSPRERLALLAAGALLVGLVFWAFTFFTQSRMDREIRALPAAERRALFLRTLDTLRTACSDAHGPALTDYCRKQAEFIRRFPECDSTCQGLAEPFGPLPTR